LCNFDPECNMKWNVFAGYLGDSSDAVAPNGVIYLPEGARFCAFSTTVPLAQSGWPRFRGNARNTGNAADVTR
jgi:hypothetical protein